MKIWLAGGHRDLLMSKPVFWIGSRAKDEPFVEEHPAYGKVYNRVGTPAEMMEMASREKYQ